MSNSKLKDLKSEENINKLTKNINFIILQRKNKNRLSPR